MSRLVEKRSGAQVLPPVGDQRGTVSAWAAHCAVDADTRLRSAAHRDLASRLRVVREDDYIDESGEAA